MHTVYSTFNCNYGTLMVDYLALAITLEAFYQFYVSIQITLLLFIVTFNHAGKTINICFYTHRFLCISCLLIDIRLNGKPVIF